MASSPTTKLSTSRRLFLLGSAIGLAGCSLKSGDTAQINRHQRPLPEKQRTFVLVHGAWHGGWCWKYVREILEAQGHRVLTPTLTGLGDRKHLFREDVNLTTHIHDVKNLILFEGLEDIVLVGHSYGGMVITGLADLLKHKISHIVYLDAGLPVNGQSFATLGASTPEQAVLAEASVRTLAPDGNEMTPLPPELFGIPPSDRLNTVWVGERLTPHPLATWLEPITLNNGGSDGLPRTYIHCVEPVLSNSSIPAIARRVSEDPTWSYYELPTGHDAMVTLPNGLAEVLWAAA